MTLLVAPWTALAHMLSHPFLRSAFLAGTAIALAAGLVGYVVVLRSQVFTGDALSHVAFTGALAALVAGADLRIGLFSSCVVFGLVMAALGRRGRPDDTVVGSAFAWVLGLGALFLSLYSSSAAGTDATAGVDVLFGSIFGLRGSDAWAAASVAMIVVVALLVSARPLVFSSIDAAVAAARGVPVRLLGYGFLVLVGVTAGEATQAVGALLLLGLLAAPAGTAQRLCARPLPAMWLSAGIAVVSMWAGLSLAYAAPRVPPSVGVMAVAGACYSLSYLVPAGRRPAARAA